MEEDESTVGKSKITSIPANYVSLAQLQERWIKEKERKEREKIEQEQLQKEKERLQKEKERVAHEKNEQERLQKQKQQQEKSDKEFRKRKPKRQNRSREVQQGKDEQRPEAVLSITTAEVGKNGTNNGSLKAKKKTLDPWKKKKNPRGVDKEYIAAGTHEPPATSTAREDRRKPQRLNEGASKDSTLGVEGNFNRLSLNHSDRRHNDGYRKYSSSFKGGYSPRQFAGNERVWNTGDRTPVSMMWVKKGRVADTDGDACETRSLNKIEN